MPRNPYEEAVVAKDGTVVGTVALAVGVALAVVNRERGFRWLGRRVEPYVPVRHSVTLTDSTLYATGDHPAVSVEADATRVSIIGCRVVGAETP